jgi:hypothetical protein
MDELFESYANGQQPSARQAPGLSVVERAG